METLLRTLLLAVFLPLFALAQEKAAAPAPAPPAAAANPITDHNEHLYGGATKILLRAAESMPEEHYAFRPVESVRTFGQIVGHIADSQYLFCSNVVGEKSPRPEIEKNKSSKAELLAALKDAFGYCERAFETLDDTKSAEVVPLFRSKTPRLGVMTVNTVHAIEHYGNLVTYMRMKNIVPPTSDPAFMAELMK